jgi:hypothetical protein
MHTLPSNSRQWFAVLLLPLKVFVLATPIALVITKQVLAISCPDSPRFHGGIWFNDDVRLFVSICVVCFFTFILAAVIQFVIGWRRDSLVSAIFAAVTLLVKSVIYGMGVYAIR